MYSGTASGVNNTAGQYYGGYQFQNESSLANLYANEGGSNSYTSALFATSVYAGIRLSASVRELLCSRPTT